MVGMKMTHIDHICLGSPRFLVVVMLQIKYLNLLDLEGSDIKHSQILPEVKHFCYSLCTNQCPKF